MIEEKRKTDKTGIGWYYLLFLLILTVFGVLLVCLPQESFSENENRYLETFESISFSGVMDKSVQENLETASVDQFMARDAWVGLASQTKKALGQSDIGGVYLGRDGRLYEKKLNSQMDIEALRRNAQFVEQFCADTGIDTDIFLVPTPGLVYEEALPGEGLMYDYVPAVAAVEESLTQANKHFLLPEFLEAKKSWEEPLFYRLDHHWTLQGAYVAYEAYQESKDRAVKPLEEFEPEVVSSDFYGTLYSKALLPTDEKDTITIATKLPAHEVLISGQVGNIYEKDLLQTKDQYRVFFGGNHDCIQITMPEGMGKGKLLVIKDSYANCFVPFLMQDYEEIVILDLRYYNESIGEFITENQFTECLVLYELTGFMEERNLYKLCK